MYIVLGFSRQFIAWTFVPWVRLGETSENPLARINRSFWRRRSSRELARRTVPTVPWWDGSRKKNNLREEYPTRYSWVVLVVLGSRLTLDWNGKFQEISSWMESNWSWWSLVIRTIWSHAGDSSKGATASQRNAQALRGLVEETFQVPCSSIIGCPIDMRIGCFMLWNTSKTETSEIFIRGNFESHPDALLRP